MSIFDGWDDGALGGRHLDAHRERSWHSATRRVDLKPKNQDNSGVLKLAHRSNEQRKSTCGGATPRFHLHTVASLSHASVAAKRTRGAKAAATKRHQSADEIILPGITAQSRATRGAGTAALARRLFAAQGRRRRSATAAARTRGGLVSAACAAAPAASAAALFLLARSPARRAVERAAVATQEALHHGAHRAGWWTLLSLLSSSCCVIQLALNMLSVGCAGFNSILGPARPFFLACALHARVRRAARGGGGSGRSIAVRQMNVYGGPFAVAVAFALEVVALVARLRRRRGEGAFSLTLDLPSMGRAAARTP